MQARPQAFYLGSYQIQPGQPQIRCGTPPTSATPSTRCAPTDHQVTDKAAANLTPAQHDHINFYGTYSFDIDAELRREGHRPLRVPA